MQDLLNDKGRPSIEGARSKAGSPQPPPRGLAPESGADRDNEDPQSDMLRYPRIPIQLQGDYVWADFQHQQRCEPEWVAFTLKILIKRFGLVDDLLLALELGHSSLTVSQRPRFQELRRKGMVSVASREGLRMRLMIFKHDKQTCPTPVQEFMRNPELYEYTPGFYWSDTGNAPYDATLDAVNKLSPLTAPTFLSLGRTNGKRADLVEVVLALWREDQRWMGLNMLESVILSFARRQHACPAQRHFGPPPRGGYDPALHQKWQNKPNPKAEDIDRQLRERAGWDDEGATSFAPGDGPRNQDRLLEWAHQTIDSMELQPGDEHSFGDLYTSDQRCALIPAVNRTEIKDA